MIKPILKSADCYDLCYGEVPVDPEVFALEINASIGEDDNSDASTLFYFRFCSYRGLRQWQSQGKDLRLNVIDRFDWQSVEKYIQERCDLSEGYDWEDVAKKLSRWAYWEYDGMDPIT